MRNERNGGNGLPISVPIARGRTKGVGKRYRDSVTSVTSVTRAAQPRPSVPRTLSELSPARQALVRLCQRLNFGLIPSISIRDADPVFDPNKVVVLFDEKLDVNDAPRPESELTDFDLAAEQCRLMTRLDGIGNGTIERIEVRGGIPRRVVFESSLSEFSLEKTHQRR